MAGQNGYWNAYLCGALLGLVLLLTFLLMGRGLGASSALARVAAGGIELVAPTHVETNSYWGQRTAEHKLARNWSTKKRTPFDNWLVWEIIGVLIGGLFSAFLAGRLKFGVDRGPGAAVGYRLAMAFGGGIISGWATRLASGCTSGQALTGGATLAVGSWIFMFAVFGGAYGAAYFFRRQWS